jgi:hypothetical protein
MTTHAPMPVAGYTAQSQANIDLANEGKQLEERMLRYIERVEKYAETDPDTVKIGERKRLAAVGRTQMQLGWMMVIRAIFNPQRIKLPED